MRMSRVWRLGAAIVLLTGCGKVGNGVLGMQTRVVSSFASVENQGEANVYLTINPTVPDAEVHLTVSGDEDLLDDIDTRVEQGRLVVDTDGIAHSDYELRVIAMVRALDTVELHGSGNIELLGLCGDRVDLMQSGSGTLTAVANVTSLEAIASGSGEMVLSGTAHDVSVSLSGSGDVKAHALRAQHGEATDSGSGNVTICAVEAIDAVLTGSGDIDIYCDPAALHRDDSGSGHIRER